MHKLLLVEDDRSLSYGLVYFFKKENYIVDHVETVADALGIIDEKDFDLIILDIGLPDGSGFDLAEKIREKSRVPIIFLTAKDEEEDLVKGFNLGGDDYITKPFSLKELSVRVKSLIKRASMTPVKKFIKSGSIKVDINSLRAYKDGDLLDLTPTEFRILLFLMDNAGKAVTRTEILEDLWNISGILTADNTISVYIRRLRDKIEYDPSEPDYIVTVRNVGYIWDEEVE